LNNEGCLGHSGTVLLCHDRNKISPEIKRIVTRVKAQI
jgi:hypothetical protein